MTFDKSNGLLIHFLVFYKDKNIFCLFSFSQISGKDMEYLSNFYTILTLRRYASLYSTEMRPVLVKYSSFTPTNLPLHTTGSSNVSYTPGQAKGQRRMCALELAS